MNTALFLETQEEVMMFFDKRLVQIDKDSLKVTHCELEDVLDLMFNTLSKMSVVSASDKATFDTYMEKAFAKHIDTKGMVPYLHTSN